MAYLISCSESLITPVDDTQIKEDSISQSKADNLIIDAHINFLNLHSDSVRIDAATGTRYAILKRGSGATPNLNDILSIHFIGKFIQETDSIFDTSYEELAKETDSLNHVALGINFNEIISKTRSGLDYEGILDSLNLADTTINLTLYAKTKSFTPISFNYVSDGSGVAGFVTGFGAGLTSILNLKDSNNNRIINQGSKMILFLPSAVGYGITGSTPIEGAIDRIPANTPIIFELDLVSIRN